MILFLMLFFGFLFFFGVAIYYQLDLKNSKEVVIEIEEEEKTVFTEDDYKFKICFEK